MPSQPRSGRSEKLHRVSLTPDYFQLAQKSMASVTGAASSRNGLQDPFRVSMHRTRNDACVCREADAFWTPESGIAPSALPRARRCEEKSSAFERGFAII
jgi:hypothetical protein